MRKRIVWQWGIILLARGEFYSHEAYIQPVSKLATAQETLRYPECILQPEPGRTVCLELQKHGMTNQRLTKKILKLKKSRYGLQDAARIGFDVELEKFIAFEVRKMQNTPFIFSKKDTIVSIHVEDLTLFAKNEVWENKFKPCLEITFFIEELGPLSALLDTDI